MFSNLINNFKNNWKSALSVALVSVPLSVSLSIASGAAPVAGIITAVWAGVFAGIFGGSKFNIVGPAGALSGIVLATAIALGPESLPSITILSGAIILIAFAFKIDRFLIFIPASVIHGFTIGVGIVIALAQLNPALGITNLIKHESILANVAETFKNIGNFSPISVLIFITTIVILITINKYLKKIPGVIIVAPLGIIFGIIIDFITKNNVPFQTLGSQFGTISATLFSPIIPIFSSEFFIPAITIALVAIIETMLSARIADGMTKTKHNSRKETLGLGLANIFSGFFGGIPASGVLVRTSLNAKAGAKNSFSQILNGLIVAIISIVFLGSFRFMPSSVIAGILVFVAVRMINIKEIKRFAIHDKPGLIILLLVTILSVAFDPLIGIGIGTASALLLFIEKFSRGFYDVTYNSMAEGKIETVAGEKLFQTPEGADVLVYSIKGHLSYLDSQAHVTRFRTCLKPGKTVILRLRELYFIDLDGVDSLDEIIDTIKDQGGNVAIASLEEHIEQILEKQSENYQKLKNQGLIFSKTEQALVHFGIPTKNSH